jgi:hypothetical protein
MQRLGQVEKFQGSTGRKTARARWPGTMGGINEGEQVRTWKTVAERLSEAAGILARNRSKIKYDQGFLSEDFFAGRSRPGSGAS